MRKQTFLGAWFVSGQEVCNTTKTEVCNKRVRENEQKGFNFSSFSTCFGWTEFVLRFLRVTMVSPKR